MVTEATSEPREEKIVVSVPEFRWAMASLISFVAGFAFLVAHLVAKADALLYAGGTLMVLFGLCRFRLRILEERREPDRARRRPLALYFIFLALLFPVIAGLFTIGFAIAALVKGGSLVSAIGRGVTTGAAAVLAVGLLEILGRVGRAFFARKSPPTPIP